MRFDNLILAVTGACAVIVTTLLVRHELQSDAPEVAAATESIQVADWRRYASVGHASGPASAPTTLVVFGDYQCPFCEKYSHLLDSLSREFPRDVRIVERHLPLVQIHPAAFDAALAAECASEFNVYPKMRSALFAHQALVTRRDWGGVAAAAGITDTARVSACVAQRTFAAKVDRDAGDAHRLGVRGTPAVMINDHLYPSPPTGSALRAIIRGARGR